MRKYFLIILICLAITTEAGGDPVTDATAILERWTSFHWGRDCLVWVVHYPEELVEPWVEAEAARGGLSGAEREDYKKAFMSELRMDAAEPFLLTIYAFGPRPLDFGGFAAAVNLVSSDGARLKPLSYERKFDEPLSGIVQGLVFFPKQPDKDFSVAIKHLGVVEEQLFSFNISQEGSSAVASLPEGPKEVVVVDLPPAPKKDPPKPKPPAEPERPLPPPPPVVQPVELAELQPRPAPEPMPLPPAESDPGEKVIFITRDKTLEKFVRYWIGGETAKMYALLSSATRTLLDEGEFARQVAATGLRPSLKDGYKVQWLEGDRAKIITAQKMLLFRTLRSKGVSLIKEDKIWKVTW